MSTQQQPPSSETVPPPNPPGYDGPVLPPPPPSSRSSAPSTDRIRMLGATVVGRRADRTDSPLAQMMLEFAALHRERDELERAVLGLCSEADRGAPPAATAGEVAE